MRARLASCVVIAAATLVGARVGVAHAESTPAATATPRAARRGANDVMVVGERNGWTEIVLSDGKRALVPSTEVRAKKAPRTAPRTAARPASPPRPERAPGNDTTAQDAAAPGHPEGPQAAPDTIATLHAEVTRLRAIVDELTALEPALRERNAAATQPSTPQSPPALSWLARDSLVVIGLSLAAGFLAGGAVRRRAARRSRSLRF